MMPLREVKFIVVLMALLLPIYGKANENCWGLFKKIAWEQETPDELRELSNWPTTTLDDLSAKELDHLSYKEKLQYLKFKITNKINAISDSAEDLGKRSGIIQNTLKYTIKVITGTLRIGLGAVKFVFEYTFKLIKWTASHPIKLLSAAYNQLNLSSKIALLNMAHQNHGKNLRQRSANLARFLYERHRDGEIGLEKIQKILKNLEEKGIKIDHFLAISDGKLLLRGIKTNHSIFSENLVHFLEHVENPVSWLTFFYKDFPEPQRFTTPFDSVELLEFLKQNRKIKPRVAMTHEEMRTLYERISKSNIYITKDRTKLFKEYIKFAQLYRGSKALQVLNDIDRLPQLIAKFETNRDLLTDEIEYPYLKKFFKFQRNWDEQEIKRFKFEKRDIKSKNPDISEKKVNDLALEKAAYWRKKHSNISLGCRSRRVTNQHKVAFKGYRDYMLALSTYYTVTSYDDLYGQNGRDMDYFQRLAYEIAVTISVEYISVFQFTKPSDTMLVGWIKNQLTQRGVDGANSYIYKELFEPSNKDMLEKFEKLLHDNDLHEELAKMIRHFEKTGALDEINNVLLKEKSGELLKRINEVNGTEYQSAQEYFEANESIPLDYMRSEDLESKEIAGPIFAAFTSYEYYNGPGIVKLGNKFWDRMAFQTGWSYLTMPKKIGLIWLQYRIMCYQQMTPLRAMAMAISIKVVDKHFFIPIYYKVRKYLVGF